MDERGKSPKQQRILAAARLALISVGIFSFYFFSLGEDYLSCLDTCSPFLKECDFDCGFSGSFKEVQDHEKSCPNNQANSDADSDDEDEDSGEDDESDDSTSPSKLAYHLSFIDNSANGPVVDPATTKFGT